MDIEIRPVTDRELDAVMPLIAAYQEFYEVSGVDRDRTRAFFGRFTADRDGSEKGWLYGAWKGPQPVGFACFYLVHNSLAAADTLLLHDLFTNEDARGRGIGRKLITTGLDLARRLGAPHLEWSTAPDNHTAQRLYDSTGAEQSSWLFYELEVPGIDDR